MDMDLANTLKFEAKVLLPSMRMGKCPHEKRDSHYYAWMSQQRELGDEIDRLKLQATEVFPEYAFQIISDFMTEIMPDYENFEVPLEDERITKLAERLAFPLGKGKIESCLREAGGSAQFNNWGWFSFIAELVSKALLKQGKSVPYGNVRKLLYEEAKEELLTFLAAAGASFNQSF